MDSSCPSCGEDLAGRYLGICQARCSKCHAYLAHNIPLGTSARHDGARLVRFRLRRHRLGGALRTRSCRQRRCHDRRVAVLWGLPASSPPGLCTRHMAAVALGRRSAQAPDARGENTVSRENLGPSLEVHPRPLERPARDPAIDPTSATDRPGGGRCRGAYADVWDDDLSPCNTLGAMYTCPGCHERTIGYFRKWLSCPALPARCSHCQAHSHADRTSAGPAWWSPQQSSRCAASRQLQFTRPCLFWWAWRSLFCSSCGTGTGFNSNPSHQKRWLPHERPSARSGW
jgi:hypothetical protein